MRATILISNYCKPLPIRAWPSTFAVRLAVFTLATIRLGFSAETPQAIYEAAKKSTFLIETYDAKGIPISLGTGFAVRSNGLASNCHVLEGANRVTAKCLDSGLTFPVEGIAASDLRRDLIVLRIRGSITPLPLDTTSGWAVGDAVYTLGNPKGLEGTFSAGIISAKRERNDVKFLQITAPISPGSSGGPVLSSTGKVIGLATSVIRDAQNLNFAVDVSHLSALLSAECDEPIQTFAAKHEAHVAAHAPERKRNFQGAIVRNFEWMNEPAPATSLRNSDQRFSFSVFNELSRTIRDVTVVISFLNQDSDPIETKTIVVPGLIGPQTARRVTSSVDASVYRLNKPTDQQHPRFADEGTSKSEYTRAFQVGTNSVVVKWKGKYGQGFKPSYTINGRQSLKSDYERLLSDTADKLRVTRVFNFDFSE